MNKKNTLIIRFKSLDRLEQELMQIPKGGKGYRQPENVILFESITGFRNFLTLQKLEILTLIATKKPKSVYELAKMVGRTVAPVQKDCDALKGAGFIQLERQKEGRGALIPSLKFSYHRILVELPQYPYELSFKAAA